MRQLTIGLIAVFASLALAQVAVAGKWCGSALNVANQMTSNARLTHRAAHGLQVAAQLVCLKPTDVCNARGGKLAGTITPETDTSGSIAGTLTYRHGPVCGVGCAIDFVGDKTSVIACDYTCPSGSKVTSGAFTIMRRCTPS